jgi:hypothetical protein
MERLLRTEVLEGIRNEINVELEARQNTKVAEQTPTNTASPKFPTLAECYIAAHKAVIYDLSEREINAIQAVYDLICRQLRA